MGYREISDLASTGEISPFQGLCPYGPHFIIGDDESANAERLRLEVLLGVKFLEKSMASTTHVLAMLYIYFRERFSSFPILLQFRS